MIGICVGESLDGKNLDGISCDFAIVTVTIGDSEWNANYQKHMMQGFGMRMNMGCMHVHKGERIAAEAISFSRRFKPYAGRAMPILDSAGMTPEQALEWLAVVYLETGSKPIVRVPTASLSDDGWRDVLECYGLWADSPTEQDHLLVTLPSEGSVSDALTEVEFRGDDWLAACG